MNDPNSSFESVLPPEIVQVGRQPILDRQQQLYGYELLYRSADPSAGAGDLDGNLASARTILNTMLEFGVQRLVGRHRMFINITRAFITELQPLPVDRRQLVMEILEDIEPDDEVVAGVRAMHEDGYTIALDDYRFETRWDPLLKYCSIVKVDILGLDIAAFAPRIAALKARGLILLAEKVETREEFERVLKLGFDLFQGYFFARPQVLSTRRLQSNPKLLLRMIARILDPDCDIEELAALVGQDPKLSFKLLRFINSAAGGLEIEINSIHQAVLYVGMRRIRAWASLFIMAGMDARAPELITSSLVRAELCHSLTDALAVGEPDSGYTIGLLSTLDALLDQPMDELVKDMPLPREMADALVARAGAYGRELNCAIALEQCRWLSSDIDLLPLDRLHAIYVQALARSEEILRDLR